MKNETGKNKENIACVFLFAFYVILTVFMVFKHEPWFDETQAWNIARDFSPSGIVKMMATEGHSSLWHFILYPFAHFGMPFRAAGFVCVFFMSAAVFLLLFKSPFPFYMKLFSVLSAGFIFVNVTVVRVYSIIPIILFSIALIYKKRFEKPILYGLLIALLCNTHPMMCGVVGILGIYMLADIFKCFKDTEKDSKYKLKQTAGLLIAGAGVIVYLLQASQALYRNAFVAENNYSVLHVIIQCFDCMQLSRTLFQSTLFSISADGTSYAWNYPLQVFLYTIIIISFVVILFLFRKSKQFLITTLFSIALQVFVNCGLWYYNVNRAHTTLFTIIFLLWIAFDGGFDESTDDTFDKKLSEINILKPLFKLEKTNKNIPAIIISVICIMTIPSAVYYIYNDYKYPFTGAEQMADYIKENLPENSNIIITDGMATPVSTSPSIKLFNLNLKEYVTVAYFNAVDEDMKEFSDFFYDKILECFPDEEKVYYICRNVSNKTASYDERAKIIYTTDRCVRFPTYDNNYCFELYEIYPDKIRSVREIADIQKTKIQP